MANNVSVSTGFGQKPLSVEEVVREAGNFDYNPDVPLKYWLRAADAIQKQAQAYERDGNDQDQYLFLMRHALLVTEKLAAHVERALPPNKAAWKKANKDVFTNLKKLEHLKPRLKKRYEQWQTITAQSRSNTLVDKVAGNASGTQQTKALAFQDDQSNRKKELDPSTNGELAARLARQELKFSTRTSSGSMIGDSASDQQHRTTYDGSDDLASQIRAVGQRGASVLRDHSGGSVPISSASNLTVARYPTVPQKSMYDQQDSATMQGQRLDFGPAAMGGRSSQRKPPERPPKYVKSTEYPPPLPAKDSNSRFSTTSLTEEDRMSSRVSAPGTGLKSSDFTFTSSASTENGTPLRTLFLPPDLRAQFLSLASSNTSKNLETCGILCGQLLSNAFFITTLLVPEQESTSDTCDTVNEEALFDYCDTHDLLTLGWIHTHPTQTCFMSSRDLHTHGGYQVQMAESIAIVCAPRHEPSWGVFRLTDPPGLKTILNCRKPGIFHPHDVSNIYTDALKPGHVWELPGLEFEVVDLRPNHG